MNLGNCWHASDRFSKGSPLLEMKNVPFLFLDLKVNLNTCETFRDNRKINLTQKEFALLVYLLQNKGRVVSRSDIARNVWDINFDTGTNIIDVYVNFLRKKIDKDFDQKLIHTQTGFGYIIKEETE